MLPLTIKTHGSERYINYIAITSVYFCVRLHVDMRGNGLITGKWVAVNAKVSRMAKKKKKRGLIKGILSSTVSAAM